MKVLFIGDIVGNAGRKAVKELVAAMRRDEGIDFCIANGENAAGGSGITYVVAQELYKLGVDVITMGNHTWSKKEILNFIESDPRLVRPANYPSELPGRGSTVFKGKNGSIGVVNVLGRVYMDNVDCPFRAAEREIEYLKSFVKVIIVDMHAEATSEKSALAWHLDGRVSCVFGTHTHVQTADEKILPCGTAFLTDVGMTGPCEGIIGVDKEAVLQKFISHMPTRFEVAKGKVQFNAVLVEVDERNGRSSKITRISRVLDIL